MTQPVVPTLFALQLSPLSPNIFFRFLDQQGAVFFFFLLLSLVICPAMASRIRQFILRILPVQFAFLLRILFISLLFSPIRSRTSSSVNFYDHFIFSIFLQHHIWKLSKYFLSNFLSVQVSEPYRAMLQT